MSAPHHSSPEKIEAQRRLLDQFLGRAVPAFPGGRMNDADQGELAFAVALDPRNRVVVVRFGKPIDWVGLDKKSALHLASLLKEKAEQL